MLESELIHSARRGSLEAFNGLVLRYQDQVFRQACWMLGDPQAADAICQETFLRAHRGLNNFRGASFCTWLLRIAHRLCLDELRRRPRRPASPRAMAGEAGQEIVPAEWLSGQAAAAQDEAGQAIPIQVIQRGLERLSADRRAVLILVDLQHLDYAQAAQVLGIPLAAVNSRLAQARQELQHHLQTGSPLAASSGSDQDRNAPVRFGLS